MKIFLGTAVMAAGAIVGTASAQNLLLNGDFESVVAKPAGSEPEDWVVDPFASSATEPARSGTWSLGQRPTTVAGSIASQGDPFLPGVTFSVSEGDPIRFRVFAQTLSSDTINRTGHVATAELFFYDSMGLLTGVAVATAFDGTADPALNPEDEWVLVAINTLAPAGSVGMGVALVLEANAQSLGEGAVYWDDASLRIIPAPGAAALLAFGVAAGARRRRR